MRAPSRDVLAMDVEAYRAAFRGSPMERAKLPAMKRNAAVVLGNPSLRSGRAALADDVDVLTRVLHEEPDSIRAGRAAGRRPRGASPVRPIRAPVAA